MHIFDEATRLDTLSREEGKARFGGAAHPGFKNMIGPYGGWSAAMMARSIIEAGEPDMRLVSLTTEFLQAPGEEAVELQASCDRKGKNTQFWSADLSTSASGAICNKALGILTKPRETVEWTEGERPDAPPPEACERFPLPMEWTKTVEMRAAVNLPFKETGSTQSVAWVRLDPDRPLDPVGLVALADTPTPRVFYIIGKPDLIATVSMSVYLHATSEDYAAVGTDYLLVEATGVRGGNGIFDQHARMWSRDGRLLATTQQIVNYRSKG
ncbi:MAG: thioesterase family protein [Alphaproteobacteria bacterium]|nr:thioesterase family protein [Alphaproteobacteria bacterium]